MELKYIVIFNTESSDSKPNLSSTQQDALLRSGLKEVFSSSNMLLFASKITPILIINEHNIILGNIFSKEGIPFDPKQLSPTENEFKDLEDYLLNNYWGEYILIQSHMNQEANLTCMREPSGGTPCVYSVQDGLGFITSDISIASSIDLYTRKIDHTYIAHALKFPYLRTKRTGLSKIEELLPGCSLRAIRDKITVKTVWSPWNFVNKDNRYRNLAEAIYEVRRAVSLAVKCYAESDGKILLELSGGLDSSIIAACLKEAKADISCCTMVPPVPGADERQYASQMADRLGKELHSVEIGFDNAHLSFQWPVETFVPGMGILQYAVNEVMVKKGNELGVASFFSGGGGDSIFGYLRGSSPAVDAFKECGIFAGMTAIRNLSDLHQCTFLKAGRLTLKKMMQKPNIHWKADGSFLNHSKLPDIPENHPWMEVPEYALPGDCAKIFELIGTQSFRDGSPRGGMAKPIRFPLLSQPVMEACLKVPTWMSISEGKNRSVARCAFKDSLPNDILSRRSKGTYTNYCGAVYKRNKDNIQQFLTSGQLQSNDFLDVPSLFDFFRAELPPRDTSFMRIFNICILENWLRHGV